MRRSVPSTPFSVTVTAFSGSSPYPDRSATDASETSLDEPTGHRKSTARAAQTSERSFFIFSADAVTSVGCTIVHTSPSFLKRRNSLPRLTSNAATDSSPELNSVRRRKLSVGTSTAASMLDGTTNTAGSPSTHAYTSAFDGVNAPKPMRLSRSPDFTHSVRRGGARSKSARVRSPSLKSSLSLYASLTGVYSSASRRRRTTDSSALPENGSTMRHSPVRARRVSTASPRITTMPDTASSGTDRRLDFWMTAALCETLRASMKFANAKNSIPARSHSIMRLFVMRASFS